mmetsp:Transcript_22446/g.29111  ORF Transcript_22446/g.29111 Transcript_22446/m.29111 type:complete len:329 (+) Transcript_22446:2-988(+)
MAQGPLQPAVPPILILAGKWDKKICKKLESSLLPMCQDVIVLRDFWEASAVSFHNISCPKVVVCWRENFLCPELRALEQLDKFHSTNPVSSLLLSQYSSTWSALSDLNTHLLQKMCVAFNQKLIRAYLLKQNASADDIEHGIRSRCWLNQNPSSNKHDHFGLPSVPLLNKVPPADSLFQEAQIPRTSLKCPQSTSRELVLVEDMPSIRKMVEKLLKNQGFVVHTAVNGLEGLNLLKLKCTEARSLYCALIDLSMPVMDGIKCIQSFRTWERTQMEVGEIEKRERVHILAFTAHGDGKRKQKALEVGANAIIPKPFKIHEMMETIDRLS